MRGLPVLVVALLVPLGSPLVAGHGAPLDSPDLAPGERHERWLDEEGRLRFGSRHDRSLFGAIEVVHDPAAFDGGSVLHIAFRNGTYGAWNGTDPATFSARTEFEAPLFGAVVWTNLGDTTETVTDLRLLPTPEATAESPVVSVALGVAAVVGLLAWAGRRRRP